MLKFKFWFRWILGFRACNQAFAVGAGTWTAAK